MPLRSLGEGLRSRLAIRLQQLKSSTTIKSTTSNRVKKPLSLCALCEKKNSARKKTLREKNSVRNKTQRENMHEATNAYKIAKKASVESVKKKNL